MTYNYGFISVDGEESIEVTLVPPQREEAPKYVSVRTSSQGFYGVNLGNSESFSSEEGDDDRGCLFGSESFSSEEEDDDRGCLFGSESFSSEEEDDDRGCLFDSESFSSEEGDDDRGCLFGSESLSSEEGDNNPGCSFDSETFSSEEGNNDRGCLFDSESFSSEEGDGDRDCLSIIEEEGDLHESESLSDCEADEDTKLLTSYKEQEKTIPQKKDYIGKVDVQIENFLKRYKQKPNRVQLTDTINGIIEVDSKLQEMTKEYRRSGSFSSGSFTSRTVSISSGSSFNSAYISLESSSSIDSSDEASVAPSIQQTFEDSKERIKMYEDLYKNYTNTSSNSNTRTTKLPLPPSSRPMQASKSGIMAPKLIIRDLNLNSPKSDISRIPKSPLPPSSITKQSRKSGIGAPKFDMQNLNLTSSRSFTTPRSLYTRKPRNIPRIPRVPCRILL
jgi:hypothetical protein